MVRASCTRDGRQWFTGSGRFGVRNTLRPGESVVYGELQGDSLMRRKLRWMAKLWVRSPLKGCPLGLIYSTVGQHIQI
jgi:hypothetical protein